MIKDKIAEIFDGKDLQTDIQYLIGYAWAEGNQSREFPSTLFGEFSEFIAAKEYEEEK